MPYDEALNPLYSGSSNKINFAGGLITLVSAKLELNGSLVSAGEDSQSYYGGPSGGTIEI